MIWPFTPVSMIFATRLAVPGLAAALALVAWRGRSLPGNSSYTVLLLTVAVRPRLV